MVKSPTTAQKTHHGVAVVGRIGKLVRESSDSTCGGFSVSHLGHQIMTSDILEQITEDYFRRLGYFTQHDVLYRPDTGGTHSDIDVVGVHPLKDKGDVSRVVAVSCKAWGAGFDIDGDIYNLTNCPNNKTHGAIPRKLFKETFDPIWSKALVDKVYSLTGQETFTFYTSTIRFIGERKNWEQFEPFRENLKGCDIKTLDIKEMVEFLWPKFTTTPEKSLFGRILQFIKFSEGEIVFSHKQTKRERDTDPLSVQKL